MRRITWASQAVADLLNVQEYIAQRSRSHADQLITRIIRRAEQLEHFPESGRVVPELKRHDVRELLESGYRLIYRTGTHEITVLTVLHSSRSFRMDLMKLM